MQIDGSGSHALTRDECLVRLASARIGHIAVSMRALPLIVPVRFAMDGDRIVISTERGDLLDAATRDTVVAFEADGPYDHATIGWSVHVNGIARHVTDPLELDRLAALSLLSPPHTSPPRIVTITTDHLSGQRATATDLDCGPLDTVRTTPAKDIVIA